MCSRTERSAAIVLAMAVCWSCTLIYAHAGDDLSYARVVTACRTLKEHPTDAETREQWYRTVPHMQREKAVGGRL